MTPIILASRQTFHRSEVRHAIQGDDESRYLPEHTPRLVNLSICNPEENSDDKERGKIGAIGHWIWKKMMRYDLERDCALTALIWGTWVIIFHPITSIPRTAYGLRLCNELFAWLPFPSDITWGLITTIPAILQMYFITDIKALKVRSTLMVINSSAFLAYTLLLALENPRTTGIPMYAALAIAQLVCLAQLSRKRFCGTHE